MDIRKRACKMCPYRRDVPSGLWDSSEYDKLREYESPTTDQPMGGFACHSAPDLFCHGWAVVGTNSDQDLFALRIEAASRWNQPDLIIPEPSTELFSSHSEAADYGQQDCNNPGQDAIRAASKLMQKYERLISDG